MFPRVCLARKMAPFPEVFGLTVVPNQSHAVDDVAGANAVLC